MTRYGLSVCDSAMSIMRAIPRIGVSLAVYHPLQHGFSLRAIAPGVAGGLTMHKSLRHSHKCACMGLRRETRKYLLYLRPESAFRW